MLQNEYLDRAKEILGAKTEYAFAKRLGLKENALAHYRHERRHMNEEACMRVADAIGISVGEVTAAVSYDRAKTPELKERWLRELKRYANIAASVLCFVLAAAIAIGGGIYPRDAIANSAYGNGPVSAKLHDAITAEYKLYAVGETPTRRLLQTIVGWIHRMASAWIVRFGAPTIA